jgi:hypothetical protein
MDGKGVAKNDDKDEAEVEVEVEIDDAVPGTVVTPCNVGTDTTGAAGAEEGEGECE